MKRPTHKIAIGKAIDAAQHEVTVTPQGDGVHTVFTRKRNGTAVALGTLDLEGARLLARTMKARIACGLLGLGVDDVEHARVLATDMDWRAAVRETARAQP